MGFGILACYVSNTGRIIMVTPSQVHGGNLADLELLANQPPQEDAAGSHFATLEVRPGVAAAGSAVTYPLPCRGALSAVCRRSTKKGQPCA